jgi:hypothetical protein
MEEKNLKVTTNNNVVVFKSSTKYEIDIEDLAANVESGGLYDGLSIDMDGSLADDFIANNREKLLVMIAKYWLKEYDK